eukprot:s7689_g1.t1
MARAGTFATLLLGALARSVQQFLETEVDPPDVHPIAEVSMSRDLEPELKEPAAAGTAFLEGESADYTHCDGLPRNGSHVIDMARIFSTSCTWHGHPGLQAGQLQA